MKVLQIVPSIAPRYGGPSVAILGLSRALVRHGIETTLFTTNADGRNRLNVPCGQVLDRDGVNIVYYNVWPANRYALSIDLALSLRCRVREFDLVHIHWLYNFAPLAGALLAYTKGIPYVIQPRGSLDPVLLRKNRRIKKLYLGSLGRLQLDYASAVIFTSEQERRLATHVDIYAPTFVVPVGLDWTEYSNLPKFGEFRNRYPQLGDKRLVLFLGRLSRQKGLDLLIKGFRIVASRDPDAHLLMVGPDSEGYGCQIKKWVVEEGLESRVTFVGPLHGRMKLAAYVDSDVFVLPSYAENFGAVVTEAMACRRPVVITNRVNICDEIALAEAGAVVECTAASVAQGIGRVLEDCSLANRLGENGYKLVQQRYTWDAVLQKLIPIYERLVHPARG